MITGILRVLDRDDSAGVRIAGMTSMGVTEHVAALRQAGELIVAAVHGADLDAIVPTCPEWTLRELVQHTGRTHRWAATYVQRGLTEPLSGDDLEATWGRMPSDADIADWYEESYQRLARALDDAPGDLTCWSFLAAPSPLAFWARRQAHEATIHRVDAQLGAAVPVDPVSTAFGLDGIDELICAFFGRFPNRLRSETPHTLAVQPTDDAARWAARMGPEGTRGERMAEPDPDCAVRGTASDLYYALWNRGKLTDLDIDGDPAVAALWAEKATIRWS